MQDSMRTSRRRFTLGAAAAALALTRTVPAFAQDKYPNKPIRWVVGFPAGGGSDHLARAVAQGLSVELGQPIVIDNRPGAGAMIGADVAARAPADGYTLWSGDLATLVFNPMIYRKIPYKVSDFQPVGMMARFNMVLATGTPTGIDTMAQALGAMRKAPGTQSYGSVGAGTPHHLVMELFKKAAGVDLVHAPYKGLAPLMQDLMGGQVQFAPVDAPTAQVQHRAGKLKVLAAMSRTRLAAFPQVPTLAELGFKDVEIYPWQAVMVHADTPRPIVEQLSTSLQKALNRQDVRKALLEYGVEITPSTPQQLAATIEQQTKFWGEVVRSTGIKLDM